MGGIAGFVYLDGKPVEARYAEAMIRSMPHRCRDGSAVVAEGGAVRYPARFEEVIAVGA